MIALLIALLVQSMPASPDAAFVARAQRAVSPIHVDGVLEEAAWDAAPPISGFRQREPDEGAPASEDTIVRVLYDGEHLYVGVLALDREPARIVSRILQRDALMTQQGDNAFRFAGDDAIALVFDTFQDRRSAFFFATNPNGAEFDALITDESPVLNAGWRGIWRVAARRLDTGWSAEFAIPFRTLRYPDRASGHAWGFNVERIVRRKNEESFWTGWSRADGGLHRVSRAGRLEGLENLPRAALNVEVKPYGLAGRTEEPSPDGTLRTQGLWRLGTDAKWEIRPGLVLDGTIRPDFSEVEADDEVINLTRFELYRPEKREFFLENAGLFDFGTRGAFETPPFLMFFSRRIGLAGEGEVPLLGGVRLSGRAGRQTLGLLNVVTGEALREPRTSFGVVRVKRDVGERSYVGTMLTDRRGGGESATDVGVDASVWATRALQFEGFAARTSSSEGSSDHAYRINSHYHGFPVQVSAEYLEVGADVSTGMGFVTRRDIRRESGKAQYTLLTSALGLRAATLYVGGQNLTRVTGELQDRHWYPGFALTWNSGDSVSITHVRGLSVVDWGFELDGRLPVAAGRYDMRDTELAAATSRNRSVAASLQVSLYDNWGGRLSRVSGSIQLRPGAHWAVEASQTRSEARMPSGRFVADVTGLRLGVSLSTRFSAASYLQYNTLTRRMVASASATWVHHPGSDLIIAFNRAQDDETGRAALVEQGVAVKVNYLFRF